MSKRVGASGSKASQLWLKNIWLKLIALTFALGFYAFIHSERNAQRTLQVAVIANMPPPNAVPRMQLLTPIPETVTVTVTGPRQQLDTLRSEDLDPIQLNLSEPQNVPDQRFDASQVTGLPPGVRVDRFIPASIEIRWEMVTTREVAVQAARTGEPTEDSEFESLKVGPAHIAATGPESAVHLLQHARAETFDVSGLGVGSHTRTLRLDPPPEGVTYNRDSVNVTVLFARRLKSRNFDAKVEVVGLPRARTKPEKVQIRVEGPPELVDALQADAIVPLVQPPEGDDEKLDFSKPGSATFPVQLDIPNLSFQVTPPNVLVKW